MLAERTTVTGPFASDADRPLVESPRMAYDEDLVDRIRELLGDEPGWSEMRMFGGLAFLINGNMAIAASGQGGLLVRADPAKSASLTAASRATPAVMRGRPMPGWLRVASEDVRTKRLLARWVRVGGEYARSLPLKPAARRRR
jgi:hypothetical protein